MKLRKIYFIVMSIIIATAIMGCDFQPANVTSEPKTSDELVASMPTEAPLPSENKHPRKIGISLPTQKSIRWERDGNYMKQMFETLGYEVDLKYAGDSDIIMQATDIESMIDARCDILVISTLDFGLYNALALAKRKNIPIIAYDRVIMDSDAVSYNVLGSSRGIGAMQGQYIVDKLDLKNSADSFNIEFVTGGECDGNAVFHFRSMMEVLQPYIDRGKLVVQSGQKDSTQVLTDFWSTEEAQNHMKKLIKTQKYGSDGKKLDVVWCYRDSMAVGVTKALLDAGYIPENFPIITGADCDIDSVKNIIAGTQSMSLLMDPRVLADRVVKMVDDILNGKDPEVNDAGTYDVPTYLCDPVVVTKENYREVLIDSGYYTEEEING